MDADLVVDDEFKPRQADTRVRQLREAESQLRMPMFIAILTGIGGRSSPARWS